MRALRIILTVFAISSVFCSLAMASKRDHSHSSKTKVTQSRNSDDDDREDSRARKTGQNTPSDCTAATRLAEKLRNEQGTSSARSATGPDSDYRAD